MAETFRVSTFNCENLFSRPAVMNLETWADGRETLEDISRLNSLIGLNDYSEAVKDEIAALLTKYRFDERSLNINARPFRVNAVREKLFSITEAGAIRIVADGRADWVGWLELNRVEFPAEQITNTGRVIEIVNADVQLLVEVENRLAMAQFNRQVLGETLGLTPYDYNLLVDGNDDRGIDLGMLSRFPIRSVRSHINDGGWSSPVFSRDCPEYEVKLPNGETLWVIGNHFKSKGYGAWKASNDRRRLQAATAANIYRETRQESELVIVAGDFNDTPDSDPLAPLLQQTDLRDIMTHPLYSGLPGTYDTCTSLAKKIDYLLLSPALWERVQAVGVERSGIWAPRAFREHGIAIMPTVTSDRNSASDHASLWADLSL